jgi:hypothetical protein
MKSLPSEKQRRTSRQTSHKSYFPIAHKFIPTNIVLLMLYVDIVRSYPNSKVQYGWRISVMVSYVFVELNHIEDWHFLLTIINVLQIITIIMEKNLLLT